MTLTLLLFLDETKPILFKEGVVDAAIKKLQSTMSFVQFKALGTLRLLSQKQGILHVHRTDHTITCVSKIYS